VDYSADEAVTLPNVFVVGTGRCGSTLLSALLNDHPAILSLSEFFVMLSDMCKDFPRLFPGKAVDAGYFWSLLSEPQTFLATTLRNGVVDSEYLYLQRPERRFDARTGIPPVLLVTLCLLSDDPEGLYDETERFVRELPPARTEVHFQRLIRWLLDRLGRRVCVERSGGSVSFTETFATIFPAAKFIHIARDGRDCAVSMSKQINYRLAYVHAQLRRQLGYNPYLTSDRTGADALDPQWRALLPETFSFDVFERMSMPLGFFGQYWSDQLNVGCPALRALGPDRVLTVTYEDLTADPERCLRQMMDFTGPGLADPDWLRRSAAAIEPSRQSWPGLPAAELAALEEACQPGFAALGWQP